MDGPGRNFGALEIFSGANGATAAAGAAAQGGDDAGVWLKVCDDGSFNRSAQIHAHLTHTHAKLSFSKHEVTHETVFFSSLVTEYGRDSCIQRTTWKSGGLRHRKNIASGSRE